MYYPQNFRSSKHCSSTQLPILNPAPSIFPSLRNDQITPFGTHFKGIVSKQPMKRWHIISKKEWLGGDHPIIIQKFLEKYGGVKGITSRNPTCTANAMMLGGGASSAVCLRVLTSSTTAAWGGVGGVSKCYDVGWWSLLCPPCANCLYHRWERGVWGCLQMLQPQATSSFFVRLIWYLMYFVTIFSKLRGQKFNLILSTKVKRPKPVFCQTISPVPHTYHISPT